MWRLVMLYGDLDIPADNSPQSYPYIPQINPPQNKDLPRQFPL